jgi:hypothetical protein
MMFFDVTMLNRSLLGCIGPFGLCTPYIYLFDEV